MTCGLDWSRDRAVSVVDARGRELVRHSVEHSAAGLRELIDVRTGAGGEEVSFERPDGPVVETLLAAGVTVVAKGHRPMTDPIQRLREAAQSRHDATVVGRRQTLSGR